MMRAFHFRKLTSPQQQQGIGRYITLKGGHQIRDNIGNKS
jgi:hypothetical protein